MTTHIVISREELARLLREAYSAGINDERYMEYDWSNPTASLPTGWLPISDAPKDGTWVMISQRSAYIDTPWRYYRAKHDNGFWRNAEYVFNTNPPTHFLPLIEPTEN